MKVTTILSALFATAALAAPIAGEDDFGPGDVGGLVRDFKNNDGDWDNDRGDDWNNNRWDNNNRGGNWNNRNPNWNNNNGWQTGRGGNEEGPYQSTCTCTSNNGGQDSWLGQQACNDLSRSFPNLQWNGNGCVDFNGQGVEYNGFRRACQQARGGNWGVDARCW